MEQIRLSNPSFEGDNNVYVFDGPSPAVVDTGDWTTSTREHLTDQLETLGLSFGDIERVFLTHWHGDHVGLAGEIQRADGATVYIHEADAPLVAGDEAAWQDMADLQERRFDEWGMPEPKRETLRSIFEAGPSRDDAPVVTTIQDGDTFTVAGDALRTVHAPGHAAGLCMYERGTEALTGDALLPKYTPNVGGADLRVDRPLEQYLDTLDTIVSRDYERAWPGHRDVIENPTVRAREIQSHHEERAWRVLDALDRLGPADAWTISADLFGELEHIHILHGPGEAHAHLEHLRRDGAVTRETTAATGTDEASPVDGATRYDISNEASTALERRERWPLR